MDYTFAYWFCMLCIIGDKLCSSLPCLALNHTLHHVVCDTRLGCPPHCVRTNTSTKQKVEGWSYTNMRLLLNTCPQHNTQLFSSTQAGDFLLSFKTLRHFPVSVVYDLRIVVIGIGVHTTVLSPLGFRGAYIAPLEKLKCLGPTFDSSFSFSC